MEHRFLKLSLAALILAGLGYAGYRYMQRQDTVEIQNYQTFKTGNQPGTIGVEVQSYDDEFYDDQSDELNDSQVENNDGQVENFDFEENSSEDEILE